MVGVFDTHQNTLYTKYKDDKLPLLSQSEEENFVMDLKNIWSTLDSYSNKIGKTRCVQIDEERVMILVYFINEFIVYASLVKMPGQFLARIADKIEQTIYAVSVPTE